MKKCLSFALLLLGVLSCADDRLLFAGEYVISAAASAQDIRQTVSVKL